MTETRLTDRLIKAALSLGESGQPVFPCYPITFKDSDGHMKSEKSPLVPGGLYSASTSTVQIRGWWDKWPEAAIGMPTGIRFDVLDIDCKHSVGFHGYDTYQELDSALGLARRAVRTIKTPSGGMHLYFPIDPDQEVHNATFASSGVDIRGTGGYVIAPPSALLESSGTEIKGEYSLIAERPATSGKPLPASEIRAELSKRNHEPVSSSALGESETVDIQNPQHLERWLSHRPEGERNSSLFWAACRLAENGGDPSDLIEVAILLGLDKREAEKTIESARKQYDN